LKNTNKSGIIKSGSDNLMFDGEKEREKILSGIYPDKIVLGRQRKHIEGTREFEQNRAKMQKLSPGSEPAILIADAQSLVDKYKGTGTIKLKGSEYPRETVDTDNIIGKTWVKSLNKYISTKRIEIIYSSDGTHVVPVNDYGKSD